MTVHLNPHACAPAVSADQRRVAILIKLTHVASDIAAKAAASISRANHFGLNYFDRDLSGPRPDEFAGLRAAAAELARCIDAADRADQGVWTALRDHVYDDVLDDEICALRNAALGGASTPTIDREIPDAASGRAVNISRQREQTGERN